MALKFNLDSAKAPKPLQCHWLEKKFLFVIIRIRGFCVLVPYLLISFNGTMALKSDLNSVKVISRLKVLCHEKKISDSYNNK